MNIRKFKQPKNYSEQEYIVLITYYDENGDEYDKDYILCKDYTDAKRFVYWEYHELKEKVFNEYINNGKEYNGYKYHEDDFEFSLGDYHNYACIYNCYTNEYVYQIDITSISNTSKYRIFGYDSSVNTDDIKN